MRWEGASAAAGEGGSKPLNNAVGCGGASAQAEGRGQRQPVCRHAQRVVKMRHDRCEGGICFPRRHHAAARGKSLLCSVLQPLQCLYQEVCSEVRCSSMQEEAYKMCPDSDT